MGLQYKDENGFNLPAEKASEASAVRIDAFGAGDLVSLVQTAILQGFRMSEENDDYPVGYMGTFHATLRRDPQGAEKKAISTPAAPKAEKAPEGVTAPAEAVSEPEAPKAPKRGRKKATN